MRVLLVTFGSDGDTRPMVALACGLRAAGHRVRLLADRSGAALAEAAGVEFSPLGGDIRAAMTSDDAAGATMRRGRIGMTDFARAARLQTTEWLGQIDAAAADADVIVGSSIAVYHALSVGETRGIVRVAAGFQPYLPTREWPPVLPGITGTPRWLNRPLTEGVNRAMWWSMKRPLNKARVALGQPPVRRQWPDYPALGAWSPTLAPVPADWEQHRWSGRLTVTGDWPLLSETLPSEEWTPPDELADFLAAGDPPVYVGFGSMIGFGDEDRLVSALLDAADGRRVLLAAGWAGLGTGVTARHDVHVVGHVPHSWLFPRCAAVVHHCGAGTSHSAVRAGVPTVPVPIAADQKFWAARLRLLGVATPVIDRHRIEPTRIRAALTEATGPGMRARAEKASAVLAAEDGVGTAVATIERLHADPGPPGPLPRQSE